MSMPMSSSHKSQAKEQQPQHKTTKKGDVIQVLQPWKIVALFLDDKKYAPSILAKLPQFQPENHNPLGPLLLKDKNSSSGVILEAGVRRLLKQKQQPANFNIWSNYTVAAAVSLVLQQQQQQQTEGDCIATVTQSSPRQEEDGDQCLEAWTWIQEFISWKDFQQIAAHVRTTMCLVSAPHPLETYATQVVPLLAKDQVQIAVQTLGWESKLAGTTNKNTSTNNNDGSTMAMRLSQLLKEAFLPRTYGIIFHASSTTTADDTDKTSSAQHDATPTIRHSCLPNTALEMVSSTKVRCIALYDTSGEDDDEEDSVMTISSVPLDGGGVLEREARRRCCQTTNQSITGNTIEPKDGPCPLCRQDTPTKQHDDEPPLPIYKIWQEAVRLGHHHFQQEQYVKAFECYRWALQHNDSLDDIRHALGALLLAQGKFLQAQQAWKDAAVSMISLGRPPEQHEGIHLQLKKQQAYQYLVPPALLTAEPSNVAPSPTTSTASAKFHYESYFNNQCFVTPMLNQETCQKLIQMAISNGKWTTGRHYAVPTNDIPVHEVPELLEWFFPWMHEELSPLLNEQFASNRSVGSSGHQRFYVHDAFFVRYNGDGKTNHLPCHLDECTHSFIICLNDDFEGGGTYFHDHDTVLSPNVGEVITFKGDSLTHGGNAVTSGTRYILAVFLYLDECSSSSPEPFNGQDQRSKHNMQSLFHEPKKQKTGFSFGFELKD